MENHKTRKALPFFFNEKFNYFKKKQGTQIKYYQKNQLKQTAMDEMEENTYPKFQFNADLNN